MVVLLLLLLLCRCFAVGCERRRRRVLVALAGLHGSNPKRQKERKMETNLKREKKSPPPFFRI
jgi:hypothetical protein